MFTLLLTVIIVIPSSIDKTAKAELSLVNDKTTVNELIENLNRFNQKNY